MSEPIRQIDRLDWADLVCPCGETRVGASRDHEEDYATWLVKHAPHSNGMIAVTADDDWSRVYAERPPDRTYPIEPPK